MCFDAGKCLYAGNWEGVNTTKAARRQNIFSKNYNIQQKELYGKKNASGIFCDFFPWALNTKHQTRDEFNISTQLYIVSQRYILHSSVDCIKNFKINLNIL